MEERKAKTTVEMIQNKIQNFTPQNDLENFPADELLKNSSELKRIFLDNL